MHAFANKYTSETWFRNATSYLHNRRVSIQERLVLTFRYVDLDTMNGKTFSYEFASILRDAGSTFTSVMDAYVKGEQKTTRNTNWTDYKKLLLNYEPQTVERSVALRPHKTVGIIIPFISINSKKVPYWWNAYNKVKHSEYNSYFMGNLENAVTAVAALKVLEFFSAIVVSDELWVNVGIAYPKTDPSYNNRPFKDAE